MRPPIKANMGHKEQMVANGARRMAMQIGAREAMAIGARMGRE
jgi:hypothetical protein